MSSASLVQLLDLHTAVSDGKLSARAQLARDAEPGKRLASDQAFSERSRRLLELMTRPQCSDPGQRGIDIVNCAGGTRARPIRPRSAPRRARAKTMSPRDNAAGRRRRHLRQRSARLRLATPRSGRLLRCRRRSFASAAASRYRSPG